MIKVYAVTTKMIAVLGRLVSLGTDACGVALGPIAICRNEPLGLENFPRVAARRWRNFEAGRERGKIHRLSRRNPFATLQLHPLPGLRVDDHGTITGC